MTREVTIISTTGKEKSYMTDAATWGALIPIISNDFSLSGLVASENITRTILAFDDSKLPDVNFIIYLRPEKTKSGLV